MHVDDLASAVVFLLKTYDEVEHINIGSGQEVSIAELANVLSVVIGYDGKLVFDRSKPDGSPRKALDSTRLAALGWTPRYSLTEGLKQTYAWYRHEFGEAGSNAGAA